MWLSAYRSITNQTGGGSPTAQTDWLTRISGPQVVWYNGFASVAEVNNYRWENTVGNDPNGTAPDAANIQWHPSGGPGNFPFMTILRPAGSSDGNTPSWWRPFSPFTGATNGIGTNDPGAGVTLQSWNPNISSELFSWTKGWYTQNAGIADGIDFWIQIRIKMDPNASLPGAVSPAKLLEITTASGTFINQNLITYLNGSFGSGTNYHRMYSGDGGGLWDYTSNAFVSRQNISAGDPTVTTGSDRGHNEQVGSATWNPPTGYCNVANTAPGSTNACWAWSGGWDTVLYHVTPGPVAMTGPHGGTVCGIQVYAANAGQTVYTKIRDQTIELNGWQAAGKEGWQALYLAAYSNNLNQPANITNSYAQVIFAKGNGTNNIPIPCPQDSAVPPTWYTNITPGTWGTIPNSVLAGSSAQVNGSWNGSPFPWQNSNGNPIDAYSGGVINTTGITAYPNNNFSNTPSFISGTFACIWGGGHQAYGGNEVYCFGPLESNTPQWWCPRPATTPPGAGINYDGSGNPAVGHTYGGLVWVSTQNKLYSTGVSFDINGGQSHNMVPIFNFAQASPATNQPWSAGPGLSTAVNAHTAPLGSTFDPTNNVIWCWDLWANASYGLNMLNLTTNTWSYSEFNWFHGSEPGSTNGAPQYIQGALDVKRGILALWGSWYYGGYLPNQLWFFRTNNGINNKPWSPLVDGHLTGTLPNLGNSGSIIYDPVLDCFVLYASGGSPGGLLYTVTPPATNPYQGGNNWTVASVTGSGSPVGENVVTCGRFNFSSNPTVRGYTLINSPTGLIHFYRPTT